MEINPSSTGSTPPLRVALDVERIDLTRAKSATLQLTFPSSTWEHDVFLVIDIYSAANPVHPEGHAGWWKWTLADREDITLEVIKSETSLSVRFNGEEPTEYWLNDQYAAAQEPVLALHVVLRQNTSGSISFNDTVQVFNDKRAWQATEARLAEFEAVAPGPVSIPWYHWPSKSTVRIVAANIFERDAVGNFAIGLYKLLRANHIPAKLYASQFDPPLRGAITYLGELIDEVEEHDLVWMNFSIYDPYLPSIAALNCRKLLYFHNITPPNFFQIYDAEYASYCAKGQRQLIEAENFDVILANSIVTAESMHKQIVAQQKLTKDAAIEFAKAAAQQPAQVASAAQRKTLGTPVALASQKSARGDVHAPRTTEIDICPPIVGQDRWSNVAAEAVNLPNVKTLLLYVGRIAPNKRIEDLFALFARYHAIDADSALLIVGGASFSGYSGYLQYLLDHEHTAVKSNIHFLSVVSDGRLKSIYEAATAFVTMSEHEGYCVPLVEAMSFDLPVFAYAEPGVAETLGASGRRYYAKDFAELAQDIHDTLTTHWKRDQIVAAQRARVAEIGAAADGRLIWSALEKVMFPRARSL